MSWLFFALIAAALYGISNIIDGYLANAPIKRIWTLVCLATITPLLFIPLIWLIDPPLIPTLSTLPAILAIGIIEALYIYPYYRSLQTDDVSVVSALFILGKFFVPFMAFVFLGETLTLTQYAGFVVIVGASTLLTLNGGKHLRFNASLPNMLFVSTILGIQAVLYRSVFTATDSWSTGFIWPGLIAAACGLIILAVRPDVRKEIVKLFRSQRGAVVLFGIEEISTFTATAAATYSISLAPVSLYVGVSAIDPFFVLIFGLLLKRFIPKAAHESSDTGRILKKIILFAVMIVGVLLVGGAQ
jgi:drug/metabolite transporter (DMT)-like permease